MKKPIQHLINERGTSKILTLNESYNHYMSISRGLVIMRTTKSVQRMVVNDEVIRISNISLYINNIFSTLRYD